MAKNDENAVIFQEKGEAVQSMRKGKSYRIAQCSMATALAVIILAFGHSLSLGEFFWYFVASLLVDIPEKTVDKAICCFVSVLLSTVLCGFNFIFMAAYCLMMVPYVLTNALVKGFAPAVRYCAVTAVCFMGTLAVCWFTPMFFVQINTLASVAHRATAVAVVFIISLVFYPLYGRVFQFGKQIIVKVWSRFA